MIDEMLVQLNQQVSKLARENDQLIRLLDEHPSWSGAQIKKQFLYLTQESV
jgi:hypothetical protein